jgi:putative peptide zinc metalloprotease protein
MTPPPGTLAPADAEPTTGSTSAAPGVGVPGEPPRDEHHPAGTSDAIPARAEGLELLGALAGSGYQRQPSLVRRADGQTLQMTPLLYCVLEAVDGRRSYAQIADVVTERCSRVVAEDDVRYLVAEKLQPLGVLRRDDGTQPEVAKSNPLLALRWRFVVSNPRVTRRITAPFATLFRPVIAVPVLLLFAAVSGWVLLEKGLGSATHQALYQPGLLLLVFALTILSAGFHEFGHAAACRYGGATPGAMGAGLYLVWPAFYTDVSDSYRLSRWGRIRVDVGGLYFNAIFAIGMLGAWAASGWDALLLLIPAQLLQMLRQLLPFVRFDGYHILADLTGVPDLFSHIKPTLLGLLPRNWKRRDPQPLKPWARAVVTLWVLLVIPILLVSLILMVKVFPRIAATAWDSLGQQAAVLGQNWSDGAVADVGVRLLSMFTIALPLVAIVYLLGRIARRTSLKVWRATDGKPRLRALAVLAAAAILALVAWAWWPDGQYEPIERHERGTLLEGLIPLAQTPVAQQQVLAMAQLGAPQAAFGATPQLAAVAPGFYRISGPAQLPPAGPGGAEPEPRLGIVLTPADDEDDSGSPAPDEGPIVLLAPESVAGPEELAGEVPAQLELPAETPVPVEEAAAPVPQPTAEADGRLMAEQGEWVFPFDEPREAREHDNQARAVNTTDGGTLYDVSFAWVWVIDAGEEHVDHRNDAYAFASCTDCTTVAIAFEVIFIVGQANVVVPQNVAMAINYECTSCQTYALAVQLIATLTDMPSDEAMEQLEAIWAFVEELETVVDQLPVEQVHAYLRSVESAMLHVLVNDDGASAQTSVAEQADGEAPGALVPTDEPTPGDPSPSATESPSPSSEPSTSPSESPSASSEPTATEPAAESSESTATESPTESQSEPAPAESEAPASEDPATTTTEAPSDSTTESTTESTTTTDSTTTSSETSTTTDTATQESEPVTEPS